MEFVDKVLKCVDCGSDFIFTAGEQLFFHDKQFKNDPKRCKQCKAKRAAGPGQGGKAASGYWAASVSWSDRDGNCLKIRQFVVIAWGAKRWA